MEGTTANTSASLVTLYEHFHQDGWVETSAGQYYDIIVYCDIYF